MTGPVTTEALAEFQRRNGYHKREIEELLTEFGELLLSKVQPAPDSTRTGQAEAGSVGFIEAAASAHIRKEFDPVAAEAQLSALAARPAAPEAQGAERVRHVKRGTEYEVLHRGVPLQIAVGTGYSPTGNCLHEDDRLVIYQGSDGKLWAREEREFDDGRFEPVSSGQGGR